VIFFLLSLTLSQRGLFDAFYLQTPSAHAGLVVFALLVTPVESALSVAFNALSRHNEREADAFAATTTGSGEPLARGLTRLAIDSLANLTPHPLHVFLHASHPPVVERVRALARHPQPT
jgi:STE24 endopeptidase